MSNIPADLKYASTHEWVRDEGDGTFTVGISEHAQELLGDMVFVELPDVGDKVATGDDIAVAESVKAASDIYAPMTGEVVAINEDLEDAPETVNNDPYGDGWLFRIKADDSSELDNLLDANTYEASIDED
ncbi:glycine cleavage system H protein [Idiomarina loihiensis]|jgi:glycine cleavage system H protein|uniref:Glycine cleavage system H protein n=1 Tax=Idiomarina loihiensis (strain ATCC BAA-735 / DSM 15497 / L2-TR) TaxID=283942 RepID=GCSH_IDILO|nr:MULTISPECIES: glycine cleavage system protein GcvH [Idiomarina]Q5R191.1 RecName: Full=Glycine cleavage system H protein [Idiomarina loihiensis L2TR]MBL4855373.1 glycine cleavage system protein GcvH [Idiomarina sp.]NWO03452.1 glycine cleavage system protein GcvH [Idiomarinaceae bacterium]AAV82925.1 Glycine cleavage system H protein (lipoate-binding) [Idiomarina loihiensis L2TR]AGM36970.1 glycine cleavage system protein H [Idiomarina loihiensis GSL 199]PWW34858.1 glycine cleavage system H pr